MLRLKRMMRVVCICLALTPTSALRRASNDASVIRRQRRLLTAEQCVHLGICVLTLQSAANSVVHDQWAAIRLSPPATDRGAILRRRRRAAQVGQLIGAGYTPRITFLAGLMLRSLQMATVIQKIFDPTLGYAAGATIAARFSSREWLPCILLGWGAGGLYWSLFSVRPPGTVRQPIRLF